jgi:hypothetical protein
MLMAMDIDSEPSTLLPTLSNDPTVDKRKKVSFSETIEIKYTYSHEVYDRSVINSPSFLRSRRLLNDFEWRKIFIELNQFKIYEMQIHPDSKNYTSIAKIPSIYIPSNQSKNMFFQKYLVNKAN